MTDPVPDHSDIPFVAGDILVTHIPPHDHHRVLIAYDLDGDTLIVKVRSDCPEANGHHCDDSVTAWVVAALAAGLIPYPSTDEPHEATTPEGAR